MAEVEGRSILSPVMQLLFRITSFNSPITHYYVVTHNGVHSQLQEIGIVSGYPEFTCMLGERSVLWP